MTSKLGIIKIIFSLSFLFFPFVHQAEGATLYFQTPKEKFYQKEVFFLDLKINTEKEKINVIQGEIIVPEGVEFLGYILEDSLIRLWAEEPTFFKNERKIFFIGGIPGGFEGEGKILTLFFYPNFSDNATGVISFSFTKNTRTLLNDGLGTDAPVYLLEKKIIILPTSTIIANDFVWQEKLKRDREAPQIFNVFLEEKEKEYFLFIFARDEKTGIKSYELKTENFSQKQKSPFFLIKKIYFSHQFKIKVVDMAGNEKEIEYSLENVLR